MMIKKVLAAFLSMSMVLASTVAFAATPAATSANPELKLVATDFLTADMDDGEGERTFAIITATLSLDTELKLKKNAITGAFTGGTGIANFTLNVAFDEEMFDMTTAYPIQTDGKGTWAYNPTDNAMSGTVYGVGAEMYAGSIAPFMTYYMPIKDNSLTVDDINNSAFAIVKLAELQVETYSNASTISESTKYSTNAADSTRNFDFATKVGTGTTPPAEPVVGTPSTVEKAKTWNIDIAGGYVTATDTLTATLYDTTNESDKQEVTLSIGSGVIEGELGWSFSLKANFNDADKMGDIGLKVAKN